MKAINTGGDSKIQVNCPPDNLKPHLNAVEIISIELGINRHRITDLVALDAFINDLIAARNEMWPYPKFEVKQ